MTQSKQTFRREIHTGLDNIEVLRRLNSRSVDLIYLDPPYNSGKKWDGNLATKAEKKAGKDKKTNFRDTWFITDKNIDEYYVLARKAPQLTKMINAMAGVNGESWAAYLVFMAVRLLELHRVLKDTGNIFLHVDYRMSHPLKMVMDSIFGKDNFRNEIVWCYSGGGTPKTAFARKHDYILFYAKGKENTFNPQYRPYADGAGYGRKIIGAKEVDTERGATMTDWWSDKTLYPLGSKISSKEKTGYPTQKPLTLLERIIEAGSNKGDVVLDPFCGCATTCVAADRADRQWIGIDKVKDAHELVVKRLEEEARRTDSEPGDVLHFSSAPPERTDARKFTPAFKRELRAELWEKQKGKCALTGKLIDPDGAETHLDHIVPKDRGGIDEVTNMQLLSAEANNIKRTGTMGEARRKYVDLHINREMQKLIDATVAGADVFDWRTAYGKAGRRQDDDA